MKVFDSSTSECLEVGLFAGAHEDEMKIKAFKTPLVFGSEGINGGCLCVAYGDFDSENTDPGTRYCASAEAIEFFKVDFDFSYKAFDSYLEALTAIIEESARFTLA